MAVTALQTVLFFKDVDGNGWTERFYYSGTTADPQFTINVSQLVGARAGLLTSACLITHVRVQSSLTRAPYVFALNPGGTPGNEAPPTAPPEVALLTLFVAPPTNPVQNRAYIRGLPSRIVQDNSYLPDAAFINSFNNFATVVTGGNWKIVSSIPGALHDPKPISNVVNTPPRGFIFTAAAGLFVVGDVVRIAGTKVPGYAGLKKIVMINPAGTIYSVGGASPPVEDTATAATASKYVYNQFDIKNCFVERLSRRASGRPFGLSRGRRSTLYSLRQ